MFSLEIDCDSEDRDLLIAELWEQGSAGIVELTANRVRAFFEDGAGRGALLKMFPGARQRDEEQRDWVQASRDLLQPMDVGRRFFVAPEWRHDPTPEGRLRIVVNPGMAFGTGVHETTRLCLEAMEDYLKPGMTVLDVGTGRIRCSGPGARQHQSGSHRATRGRSVARAEAGRGAAGQRVRGAGSGDGARRTGRRAGSAQQGQLGAGGGVTEQNVRIRRFCRKKTKGMRTENEHPVRFRYRTPRSLPPLGVNLF
jgi:hypothetical protein